MITRAAFRLRSPTTNSPASYLHTLTRFFSSSQPASSSTFLPGTPTAAGESDAGCSRKYPWPSTITWTEGLHNSFSCIGHVGDPVTRIETRNDSFGVHTSLRLKTSGSNSACWIKLFMWNELARIALQHLKPNDYIYVSGQLGAYSLAALNGVERIKYKVTANELNYVKQDKPEVSPQRILNLASEGQSAMEKQRSRLLMWQALFANPIEWYDNRKTKKTPSHPDFRHKSTGEALWLSDWDPLWVKKQLELLDSRPSCGGPRNVAPSEYLSSRWAYE